MDKLKRQEKEAQVTEWLTEWGSSPPDLGMPDFEEAYRRVRAERPRRPAPQCRLLRRLVRRFHEDIQSSIR